MWTSDHLCDWPAIRSDRQRERRLAPRVGDWSARGNHPRSSEWRMRRDMMIGAPAPFTRRGGGSRQWIGRGRGQGRPGWRRTGAAGASSRGRWRDPPVQRTGEGEVAGEGGAIVKEKRDRHVHALEVGLHRLHRAGPADVDQEPRGPGAHQPVVGRPVPDVDHRDGNGSGHEC